MFPPPTRAFASRPALPAVFAALALVLLLAPAAAVAASGPEVRLVELGGDEAELIVTVPPVRWLEAGGGVRPEIDGFGRLAEPGAPDLPLRRARIARHPGARLSIVDVEVTWAEGSIPGALLPYPAERTGPAGARLDGDAPRFAAWWPERPVVLHVEHGVARTLHFGSVALRPLQVDLAAGRFRVARRIVVRVRRHGGTGAAATDAADADPAPPALRLDAQETGILGAERVGRAPLGGTSPAAGGGASAMAAPSFPAYALEVDTEGLHRVTYAWAQANAPGLLAFLTANDPRQLRLVVQGVEVPILVDGEGDGTFDAPASNPPDGDALVFYGQPVSGDPFDPDVWQDGDFTDVNVYRLELGGTPARIGALAGSRAPQSGYAVPASFRASVHYEEDRKFQGFVPQDGDEHWFVDPFIIAPVCVDTGVDTCPVLSANPAACGSSCTDPGEVCCAAEGEQGVPTPGHAGGSIDLRVALMAIRGTDYHRTQIDVDGTQVDQADWDGFVRFAHGVDQGVVSHTPPAPLGPTTAVTVRAPLGRLDGTGADVTKDWIAYDWVEIDYDRLYEADGGALLFDAPDLDREIRIAAFGALPEVWEVTKTTTSAAGLPIALPERVQGVTMNGTEARFELDAAGGGEPRRFASATAGGYRLPSAVREDTPPSAFDPALGGSLADASLGADWLVIGPASMLDLSPGSELDQLLGHRQGQGLDTMVVDVRDVYDEFSAGLVDPQGIKEFLRHALQSWSTAPSYVILLGDASWDYKNNLQNVPPRQVLPTYMFDEAASSQFGHYPSDTWFAAVLGTDEVPDLALGRIPAHSLAEAEVVFRKIRVYETGPQPVSWAGRALLISEFDDEVGGEFFRVHDEVADAHFTGQSQTAVKIYESDPALVGCNVAADNQNLAIDTEVNAGAAIMSFSGHGGFKNWAKTCDFFAVDHPGPDDLDDIALDTPLPFTIQANCITGNIAATSPPGSSNDSWYSFVEDWLLTDRKGVVGGLAPSHLSFTFELDIVLDPFFKQVYGKRKERVVGEIDGALRSQYDVLAKDILLRSMILQGDPALTLAVPAPPAPTLVSLSKAGSGELQADWTSVPGASAYRLYRAGAPSGPYTLVVETASTSWLDSGLSNCVPYYYYVVAVDADGFESRWSNLNEDCFGAQSDCGTATPENPLPPAPPLLLSVTDTQAGGQLEVVWDIASQEPDLVLYEVSWGTSQGVYTSSKTVFAANDRTTLSQLVNGVEYFVSVAAENCSSASGPSNELSAIPRLVRGLNPPRSIDDLMVFNAPDGGDGIPDNRLTWSLPSDTVWGVGTTLQGVEVHGSSSGPAFAVGPASLLASLGPAATEWFHEDQAASGAPDWYYLVVTVDVTGARSAAGVELPAPVDDLTVTKAGGGGQVTLSWGAVTETMATGPSTPARRLVVAGYDVYGRPSVLPRLETGPANLVQSGVAGLETTVAMPPDGLFTWQVLAVSTQGDESAW